MYNRKEIKVENASNRKKKNPNLKGTSKNIQSSVNELFMRNQDLFGSSRKKMYLPYENGGEINNFGNMKRNMKKGGEAFPQQPTEAEFFQIGYIPQSPVGFYAMGGEPCFECGGQHMEQGGENWIQKANKSMKARGTEGAFTDYCGGKVTAECIERGLNSPDETTRKRAAFAKAMHTIKKAMGGEADTSSTDNYIAQQNDYFKNALNFNSLNSMMMSDQDGDLFKAVDGVNVGAGYKIPGYGQNTSNAGGPNAQTFSQGRDLRFIQQQNPNLYTQTPVPYGYGYNPHVGWFGGMLGRVQPRYKININYNGMPGQMPSQQGQGSSSSAASTTPNIPQGNPFEQGNVEVIKAGLLHKLAPKRFAPKHYKVTWGQNQAGTPTSGNPANTNTAGLKPSASNNTPSPGFTAGFPAVYGPQNAPPPPAPYQPKYMGPDINEPDTQLPPMNVFTPADPYVTENTYSPFANLGPAPMGPVTASGGYKKYGGNISMYNAGGSFESKRSWGFDMSNLNPDNVIAGEQAIANFLNRGQNQRIMDEQMARNMDVMNFSPTNTEFDRGFNMFDPTIMQNPEKTGVMVTSAGQSNWDGQRQYGGQIREGDEVEMSDEELQEFFRNGGTVEYLD